MTIEAERLTIFFTCAFPVLYMCFTCVLPVLCIYQGGRMENQSVDMKKAQDDAQVSQTY